MRKIPTLFDRDWDGNRGVVDRLSDAAADVLAHPRTVYGAFPALALRRRLVGANATEKLDGTNVRLTVRAGQLLRLEKRRNPSKAQKADGITDPWYVDASPDDPADEYIYDAAQRAWSANGVKALRDVPDGEWEAEALGPRIQGNPLDLPARLVVLFSLGDAPKLRDVPVDFERLREWLPLQRSALNPEKPIEGVVWHLSSGAMVKIKTRDFKERRR